MNIRELLNVGGRTDLEILLDGQWVTACVVHVHCGTEMKHGIGLYEERGSATFREIRNHCLGSEHTFQAHDIPHRVRLPLEGRNLTAAEVDRYCGASSNVIAIERKVADALARSAKVGLKAEAELEKVRAQLKSVKADRDAYKKQALDRADVLAQIGDELTKTGFATRDTKYTETIKKLNEARETVIQDRETLRIVYEKLVEANRKNLRERDDEKRQRQTFQGAIAHAVGLIWLGADVPSEGRILEQAKNLRPSTGFYWRTPDDYRREIDQLKKEREHFFEQKTKLAAKLDKIEEICK